VTVPLPPHGIGAAIPDSALEPIVTSPFDYAPAPSKPKVFAAGGGGGGGSGIAYGYDTIETKSMLEEMVKVLQEQLPNQQVKDLQEQVATLMNMVNLANKMLDERKVSEALDLAKSMAIEQENEKLKKQVKELEERLDKADSYGSALKEVLKQSTAAGTFPKPKPEDYFGKWGSGSVEDEQRRLEKVREMHERSRIRDRLIPSWRDTI
jgi:hypothetical protein